MRIGYAHEEKWHGRAEAAVSCRSAQARTQRSFERNSAAPEAVNLSVDAELLKVAKEMNINLSRALESALLNLTTEERARRFYKDNKAAIDSYNRFIGRHGTLAENFYGRGLFSSDDPAI
jgi:antitoxin CcdA